MLNTLIDLRKKKISKKDAIQANSTCAITGKKIKKEEGVQFVGFENMLGYLNIK